MDIDSSSLKDQLNVVEYIDDIYAHYRKSEVHFSLVIEGIHYMFDSI